MPLVRNELNCRPAEGKKRRRRRRSGQSAQGDEDEVYSGGESDKSSSNESDSGNKYTLLMTRVNLEYEEGGLVGRVMTSELE
jgi:hypothetical protein